MQNKRNGITEFSSRASAENTEMSSRQTDPLPAVKALLAGLTYGLDSDRKPLRGEGASWLEKILWTLLVLFFSVCLLIVVLHYARQPFDQILRYIYSPLIVLTSFSYIVVAVRGGFRWFRKVKAGKGLHSIDRQLKYETPMIEMLLDYSSARTSALSKRLKLQVKSNKDLINTLAIAAVALAALMAACVSDIAIKNKTLASLHPLIAILIWLFSVVFVSFKLVGDVRAYRRLAWVLSQASKASLLDTLPSRL